LAAALFISCIIRDEWHMHQLNVGILRQGCLHYVGPHKTIHTSVMCMLGSLLASCMAWLKSFRAHRHEQSL
jgi:hypothetical protein